VIQRRVNTVPASSANIGPWKNYCWIAWPTQVWCAHQHPGLQHPFVIFPGKCFQHFKVSCTNWRFWGFVAFMSIYVTFVNLLLIVVFLSLFHLSDVLWVVLIKSHIMTNVHCPPWETFYVSNKEGLPTTAQAFIPYNTHVSHPAHWHIGIPSG